jgi:hypothetical protein
MPTRPDPRDRPASPIVDLIREVIAAATAPAEGDHLIGYLPRELVDRLTEVVAMFDAAVAARHENPKGKARTGATR